MRNSLEAFDISRDLIFPKQFLQSVEFARFRLCKSFFFLFSTATKFTARCKRRRSGEKRE